MLMLPGAEGETEAFETDDQRIQLKILSGFVSFEYLTRKPECTLRSIGFEVLNFVALNHIF